jgi:hypothetical protein
LRLSSVTIDADGSPSGYVAWYNHSTEIGKIRPLRPVSREDRFGVQRMEMLAIYFALVDNRREINKIAASQRKSRKLVINVRSDSKTSVEQLQGISRIRDSLMQRIYNAIMGLLQNASQMIVFNHLDRKRNIAGLLLDQRRRRHEEMAMMHEYQMHYYSNELRGFLTGPYGVTTA